jgi:hypothetical protein
VGGDLTLASSRARLYAGGTAARFDSGTWSATAYASGAALLRQGRRTALTFTADATGYAIEGDISAYIAAAGVSGAFQSGRWLFGVSASGGSVQDINDLQSDLWSAGTRLQLVASGWDAEAAGTANSAGATQYGDLSITLTVRPGPVVLQSVGGVRLGDLGDEAWGHARVEWTLAGPVALEAAAGRYPRDITGFLQGTYVSAGLRVRVGRAPGSAGSLPVDLVREGDVVVATFRVADAAGLAIAGEWNDWQAQPLVRHGSGRWQVVLPLRPGVYRFSLVDGAGRWFVPEGVTAVDDEFGGRAGLLVVSR